MPDLPKRGDRVRVTEIAVESTLELHDEATLSRDALPHHDDWIHFDYEARIGPLWSGAVKVEILERAKTIEELIAASSLGSTGGHAPPEMVERVTRRVDELDRKAEFARGMRRAVEIAEHLDSLLAQYDELCVGDLRAAVEQELKNND